MSAKFTINGTGANLIGNTLHRRPGGVLTPHKQRSSKAETPKKNAAPAPFLWLPFLCAHTIAIS